MLAILFCYFVQLVMLLLSVTALNVKDHDALGEWCLQNDISLVVIGPEDPLADGMVDVLTCKGQYNYICI